MANYSHWHTKRSSSKKVHAIEEINVLSGKMDELMKLFTTKNTPLDLLVTLLGAIFLFAT